MFWDVGIIIAALSCFVCFLGFFSTSIEAFIHCIVKGHQIILSYTSKGHCCCHQATIKHLGTVANPKRANLFGIEITADSLHFLNWYFCQKV